MVPIKITPHQREILLLLYRFRFLNRHHLQSFLNHKDPKRIKVWLKDLTNKKLIGRIYSNTIGENTKPAIYYLASKSHNLLKEEKDTDTRILKRVYRERLRSKRLREHCLLLADIYFLLQEQYSSDTSIFHFFTKTDLVQHSPLPPQRPDAYIASETEEITKRYFLEIIDADTPRFVLRAKIKTWIEFFDEETWQKTTKHPFPKILIVCSSESIKEYLDRYIANIMESELAEIDFYLCTTRSIHESQLKRNVWQKVDIKD